MNITKVKFNQISSIAASNKVLAALIFGQNNGLALEMANSVFGEFRYDLKEVMTEEEILADNNILFSSVSVDDFFAESKLIKIYNVTSKFYTIFEDIYLALQRKKNIRLCLVGEDIGKSKIRSLFEDSEDLISVCCYFDEQDDARACAVKFFNDNSIKFDKYVIDFLAQNLYGDRRVLKNELDKIKLSYIHESNKVITKEDVEDVIENQNLDNVFDFIDNFCIKNKSKSVIILEKLLQSEEITMIGLIHILYRNFQSLVEMLLKIESGKSTIDGELFSVFFKRKFFVKRQLELWNSSDAQQMISFLTSLENAAISQGELFAKQLLINRLIRL